MKIHRYSIAALAFAATFWCIPLSAKGDQLQTRAAPVDGDRALASGISDAGHSAERRGNPTNRPALSSPRLRAKASATAARPPTPA